MFSRSKAGLVAIEGALVLLVSGNEHLSDCKLYLLIFFCLFCLVFMFEDPHGDGEETDLL